MTASRELIWTVLINGVRVGRIEDSRYQWLIQQSRRDRRLYLAQAVEILKYALRMFTLFVMAVPLFAFWALLGLGLLAPDDFQLLISRGLPALVASPLTSVVMLAVGLSCGIATLLRGGVRNVFNDRRDELLRRYLKVAIPGELVLVCWDARSALHTVSPTP
ncbi:MULTISPECIES: hypothetical protein [unclassified Pseudomonas]|uniref:hypothetical protein n=1 Tax=unclassified Pseudomonas TaxID=196821 RepID=UPI0025811970|nr:MULTISPECIES: hypothetical protein [unclassified Pseudomonas]